MSWNLFLFCVKGIFNIMGKIDKFGMYKPTGPWLGKKPKKSNINHYARHELRRLAAIPGQALG